MRSAYFDRLASWLVLSVFCAVLALVFFLPIYTDEIAIKLVAPRMLRDHFVWFSLYPQCGVSFSSHLPWTLVPGGVINWFINGSMTQPIFIRIIGVLTFVAWLAMLTWFMQQKLQGNASLLSIMAGLVSFISLGIMPFLMVLNRSEQPILIGLTLICLSPYIAAKYQPSTNKTWIVFVAGFFLVTSYMLSIHPKPLLFIPVMLAAVYYLAVTSRRVWVGVLLSGWLAVSAYQSYKFWTSNLNCSDAPFLNADFKSQSLSLGLLLSAPSEFLMSGLRELKHSYVYIKNALFELRYSPNWLPPSHDQTLGWFSSINDVAISLIYFSTLCYSIFALTKRVRHGFDSGKFLHETTMPLALFVGMFLCGFFLAGKFFYESALMLPLLLLLVLMLLPKAPLAREGNRAQQYIFKLLLVASIASQINLILTFAPYPLGTWLAGGQVDGQRFSISSFNYNKIRGDIIRTAENCGITVDNAGAHLVIDNSTYFPFKDTYMPFHLDSILGRDVGDGNLMQFLKVRNSAGLITRCDSLSPEIRKLTKQNGNYCCIGKQDINK